MTSLATLQRRIANIKNKLDPITSKTIVSGNNGNLPDDYNPKCDRLNMHVVVRPEDTQSEITLSWKGENYTLEQLSQMANAGNESGVYIYKTVYEPMPEGISI